jgi:poly-gamma-glutamate capsule biosynthesis protein CapA/YwtB (metallophosphatase superfamily)
VLDVVLESVKTPAPASAEALSVQTKDARKTAVASAANTPTEARPSEASAEARPLETAPITRERECS